MTKLVGNLSVTPVGQSLEKGNTFIEDKGLLLFRPGTSIATKVALASKATFDALIASKSLFIIPGLKEVEAKDVEADYYTSPSKDKIKLRNGKRGKMFKFNLTKDQSNLLFTLQGKGWEAMTYDGNNNLKCTFKNSVYCGFKLSYFDVILNEFSGDKPEFSVIEIQYQDNNEWDKNGFTICPEFLFSELEPLTKLVITPGTVSSNSVPFSVAYVYESSANADGSVKSEPASGIVAANLQFKNGAGAVVTPTGITESATSPGDYVAAFTTFTTGSVEQIPSATSLFYSDKTVIGS